jgi:hypothetical protein
MSIRHNARDLFDFIADVYAIDLSVIRDVLAHNQERWWIANLVPGTTCLIKDFQDTDEEEGDRASGNFWLSTTKSACDNAPSLPDGLCGLSQS